MTSRSIEVICDPDALFVKIFGIGHWKGVATNTLDGLIQEPTGYTFGHNQGTAGRDTIEGDELGLGTAFDDLFQGY
ncbi:hypothetical protein BG006_009431 [Podila minutissima]|uniref:Uncharacterized protein n=1 Tax=Podila minutissima TaxID=64525 RepID=A0A9P5VJ78_9FUNG|nr:hypothetical protein BG006_009431 [Podila minutissima]